MPSLAIRHRLIAVVLFSLLPIGLLGYLFFAQSDKEIAFSAKELRGTQYIVSLMPDLVALATQGTTAKALPANAALESEMAANDAAMNSAAVSRAYRQLRSELASGGHPAVARHAAARLVTKVGDGSNLILDPDLDSYYVMDTLVLKLPQAINAAPALLGELAAAKVALDLGNDDLVALVANLGAFRAIVSGASASLAASAAANADGSVKRNLEKPLAAYLAAARQYGDAIEAASAALGEEAARAAIDLDAVTAAHNSFQDAALTYWRAVGSEMSRLLGLRLDGFNARLWSAIGISAVLVAIVLVLSALLARSIVRGLSRLESDIHGLADGAGEEIRGAARNDEIAAIARAVAHLRDRTVARLGEADSLKAAEQRRADEMRMLAEQERDNNEEARTAEIELQRRAVTLLGEGLERLARGDLAARIEVPFGGELDALRLAFNNTIEHFANVIGQVRETSRMLKTATGELLAGTNDLSDRTSRQATTIDEISATIEQLATAVAGNADRATSASATAEKATQAAEAGGAVMHSANEAMERITASSSKISNIVGLIDDIAFQTNLLALNASVEAARAGEAGKGFAVVAIEVRRLAQSAAEASKEIKTLIEQSVDEVEGGSKLVAEAVERLSAMLEAARSSTALMYEMAEQSHAQAASIGEVTVAVRQMHEMTQHNAALVEETNAAIEQTEAQASELDQLVERFSVEDAHKAAA